MLDKLQGYFCTQFVVDIVGFELVSIARNIAKSGYYRGVKLISPRK